MFESEWCRDCRGKSKWWTLLLTSLVVIVFALLVLWINSVVFYYQVVYLVLHPQQETGIMKTIIGVISLLGLRVDGVGFCVYDGLIDLDKVMLKYLFPLMMI